MLGNEDTEGLKPFGALEDSWESCLLSCENDFQCKQVTYDTTNKNCYRMSTTYVHDELTFTAADNTFNSAVCGTRGCTKAACYSFCSSNPSFASTTLSVPQNRWAHIGVSVAQEVTIISVDGEEQTRMKTSQSISEALLNSPIVYGRGFYGDIDEVKISVGETRDVHQIRNEMFGTNARPPHTGIVEDFKPTQHSLRLSNGGFVGRLEYLNVPIKFGVQYALMEDGLRMLKTPMKTPGSLVNKWVWMGVFSGCGRDTYSRLISQTLFNITYGIKSTPSMPISFVKPIACEGNEVRIEDCPVIQGCELLMRASLI